jgi:hypothetical protein
MNCEVKKWWKSKTLWLNALAMIIGIVQLASQNAWLNPELQVLILAILNAILRFITNTGVTTQK